MKSKIIQINLALVFLCSTIASAQIIPTDNVRRGVDPNNASIEGRIVLPSGQAADFNIKIVFKDYSNILGTYYTNKHAEFRLTNLSEGTYYIEAIANEKIYDPVTVKINLVRSQNLPVTITLRRKEEFIRRSSGPLLVSASELQQPVPPAARKEYEQGVKQVIKGNVQNAIDYLQHAVELYPDYIAAHNDLGAQYLKLKRLDRAVEHFRAALKVNPKYFNSLFNLALVLMEQKNYTGAVAQFYQAIAADPSQPVGHLWLGIALMDIGDLATAERELTKALITGGGGDFVSAHFYLAQIYLKVKNNADAERSLRAYLQEAPKGEFAEDAKMLLKSISP
ncbi:MAG TPA: tetratricopeptide repeat protein, partial [Blastocatellia bacterium]|nr:tetratricopeptide repeat protein [Blastocatellia bacterium]